MLIVCGEAHACIVDGVHYIEFTGININLNDIEDCEAVTRAVKMPDKNGGSDTSTEGVLE